MRDGLKEILPTVDGFELLAKAANGNEVLDALHHMQPDLLMMDMFKMLVQGKITTKLPISFLSAPKR